MRAAFLALLLLMSAQTHVVSQEIPPGLKSALEGWAPMALEVDGRDLVIVLPQRQVTDMIYRFVIDVGICSFAVHNGADLTGFADVQVVNQWRHQGWVLDGPLSAACEELRSATREQKMLTLLGRSHLL